jgi:hypothetical protein
MAVKVKMLIFWVYIPSNNGGFSETSVNTSTITRHINPDQHVNLKSSAVFIVLKSGNSKPVLKLAVCSVHTKLNLILINVLVFIFLYKNY